MTNNYVYELEGKLYINLTNLCTNDCVFCIRSIKDDVVGANLFLDSENLDVEEVKKQLDNIKPQNYKEIVFCGYGEPILKLEELKETAKYIKEKYPHLKTRINTNGQGNLIYKRNFSWIKVENVYDKKLLPDRGAYLIMQAGYLLFNATDTVVLSIFCGFKLASVYTVYMMVYLAIKQVATALRNNFQYVIGQGYTKCRSNTKEYLKVYDLYQNGINTVTTCMLAICYILVLPFITLYTSGVTDINYINTALPIFFTLNLLFDDWNYPGSLLIKA